MIWEVYSEDKVDFNVENVVHVALVEVKPLPGYQLAPKDVAGAVVLCYVAEYNSDSAIERIATALTRDGFKILELELWIFEDSIEWESPDDKRKAEELVSRAINSGEVVYGDFHSWGYDAPDKTD